jgi:flagellar biosynthesis chaperone FliJ
VTGLACEDDRRQGSANSSSTPARIFESVGYYQSMTQSKIEEIINEIDRLRSETADGNHESCKALENKHEELSKAIQTLEGDLTDYLAKKQARSGTSHEDVQNSTLGIVRRNEKMKKEIDKIFFSRKKAEGEISWMESELKRLNAAMETKFLEGDDAERVHGYSALVNEIELLIDKTKQEEDDTILMRHKIKMMVSNNGQGFHSQ